MEQKDEGSYLKVKIEGINLPTIGANGTIWRTEVLRKAVAKSEYLVDFEILYILARKSSFYFAKVKVGIVHLYCSRLRDFYRKQKRRARDFFYQESAGLRKETYQRQLKKQLYFIVCAVTVWPLIYQAIKGYLRKPDPAWLFHPLACWLTLWIYASETILALFRRAEMSREEWSQ
jgi:hypothetical protein